MATNVKVIFDRRKRVQATGKGNVEIIIQLSRLAVKKIIVDSMTPVLLIWLKRNIHQKASSGTLHIGSCCLRRTCLGSA